MILICIMILSLRMIFVLLPLITLTTGCFATHLVHDEPLEELDRLVESSPQGLSLVVHDPIHDVSHGYQFLLGILPIARVFAEDARQVVAARLQLNAAESGVGLSQKFQATKRSRKLEVTISSLEIDGYDLLVFRRPSAQITLTGKLFSSGGLLRACTQVGEHSEITRFAFSPDLTRALSLAADAAAKKLLACLDVTSLTSYELPQGGSV
jgi:hypothetical protein